MSINLPLCPVEHHDLQIIKSYLEREKQINELEAKHKNLSLGRRILGRFELSATLNKINALQQEATLMYPDVLSEDVIASYQNWLNEVEEIILNKR